MTVPFAFASGVGRLTARPRQILGLDLIRFAAAAGVMVFHLLHRVPFSWVGWIGVDVFFVLSGYVIAFSAEAATAPHFAIGRFSRIMPAVWICGAVGLAIAAWNRSPDLLGIAMRTAVLWPVGPWVTGVYWTLPIEVAFYAVIWLALWRGWSAGLVATGLLGLSCAWWVWRHLGAPAPEIGLATYGALFALGMILRRIETNGTSPLLLFGLAACWLLGADAVFRSASVPGRERFSHEHEIVPLVVWTFGLLAMWVSIRGNGWAWRKLGASAPVIRQIGLATYPLYLLHYPIGMTLERGGVWPLLAVACSIAAAFAVSLIFEPPAQRALRRILTGPPIRRGAVVANAAGGQAAAGDG